MEEESMKLILRHLKEIKASSVTQKKLLELTKKTVLDTTDVALIFNRSNQTIHIWRRKKEIAYKRINGRYFYTWDSILALFNEQK
jgi:hypothetical protein